MATLQTLHPLLPWSLLTLAIWVSVYLLRRYIPALWELPAALRLREVAFGKLPGLKPALSALWTVWQGLPSILLGALVGAWQLGSDPGAAWKGAAAGALAPALHHLLKALPFVPYRGELGAKRKLPPLTIITLALACLCLGGCSNWKPAARTANDLAADFCAVTYSEIQGISVEDALRTFCNTHEKVKPFLDELLAAQKAAGAKAGLTK